MSSVQNITKKAAIICSGALALGLLFAAPQSAQAGELKFGVTIHQPGFSVTFGNLPSGARAYKPKRHRACSPHRAVKKAKRIGVRHARIHRIGKKGTVVKGRLRGKQVIARFNRNCSLRNLRWR